MSDADSLDHGWGSSQEVPALTWQVNTRGRKLSEMTLAELGANIRGGKLTGRTLVWSEGMAEWTPLGEVPSLAKLLRDSTPPPPSGTRPRLEELVGAAGAYTLTGDTTTDTGGIAIYERPLAMLEFPKELADVEELTGPLEELSEPEDEPTRATITPARVIARAPRPAVPALATAALHTHPSASRPKADAPAEPALPPLPPMRSIQPTLPLFPAPVSASPLAAALTSTTDATPTSAKASDANLNAVEITAAEVSAATPDGKAVATPADATVTADAESDAAPESDPEPESDAAPTVRRVRPAIEFLPPIIVHEKEDDDGASAILELPLHAPPREAPVTLREAPFSESTLVLSGRRRGRRWIPLNAAISLGVGAACLASALTAVTVRTRPAPPRVVEKIVTVPVPAVPAADTAARAPSANAPVTTESGAETATRETTHSAAAERAAKSEVARPDTAKADSTKTESRGAGAPKTAGTESDAPKAEAATTRHRDGARADASGLDAETKPADARREARAGFPTNPGF